MTVQEAIDQLKTLPANLPLLNEDADLMIIGFVESSYMDADGSVVRYVEYGEQEDE